MKKSGDCMFVSLQIIQDWGTVNDKVRSSLIGYGIPDNLEPYLVHAYVTSDDKEFKHAMIQVDDWVIDLSNGTSNVCRIDDYRDIHQVREPKLFDRNTVLAILYSGPSGPFWDYSEDDLEVIRKNAESLHGIWPTRIDFLQAFQDDINPLQLLHFPNK
jgi:hypothetical protein